MRINPGKTLSIYVIPGIVATALPKATSEENIKACFAVSGICPFDRHIFVKSEFAPSDVADCPQPEEKGSAPAAGPSSVQTIEGPMEIDDPCSSTLEDAFPLPKAGPRASQRSCRRTTSGGLDGLTRYSLTGCSEGGIGSREQVSEGESRKR